MNPSQLASLPKARALYENQSESPQELSFKSGDVLYVVEQDVAGYSGWWLCYSGQKLGIAPGNRLKLLTTEELQSSSAKVVQSNWQSISHSNFNALFADNKLKFTQIIPRAELFNGTASTEHRYDAYYRHREWLFVM